MPKKAENPYNMGYDPVLDTSPALDPDNFFIIYHWHPKNDDQIGEKWHNNWDVITVVPFSAPQRGTIRSSNTFYGPCWSEVPFQTDV